MSVGISKKFCVTILGIQTIAQMSAKCENPFKYACLIAGIIIVYKAAQIFKDVWMKPKN